jgi:C-terminal processing protease CtpA/Prc
MMLELGHLLRNSDWKANNYLLVAFSGEELGLWGSKWLADHLPETVGQINYMLNFDMVGRIDSQSNALIINGTGTSPHWANALRNADQQGFQIKTTESGVGPSDHTSFYLKNIPVLHFFSGNHEDYHKPADDEHKINYSGMSRMYMLIKDLIRQTNQAGKIAFTKTKDQDNENAPRFTVTLGVVPDYTYDGEGMRIDAVTEGKTASVAGLKQGDVVLQLGVIKVTDMMSYMKALATFRKGDKTRIRYKRGGEEQEKDIQF